MLSEVPPVWKFLTYLQLLFQFAAADHVSDYNRLCPYSNLCQTDALSIRHSGEPRWPCCVQCSCADNCYLFKRCCPDKTWNKHNDTEYVHRDMSNVETNMCHSQSDLYNAYFGTRGVYRSPDYHVVKTCPALESVAMREVANRCYNGADTLYDAHFVSDVNNETLYFNKYCAQCNGVDHVVDWHLKAICKELAAVRLTSEQDRDTYTIVHCEITSVPPTKELGMKFLCDLNAIDTCNQTGYWDFYDPQLERNCLTYDIVYTAKHEYPKNFNVYSTFANVYCFLCNMPEEVLSRGQCDDPYVADSRSFLYPFTYIISTRRYETEQKEVTCQKKEFWDPFLLTCRELLCPLGTIPSYGECLPIVDQVIGMTFQIYHRFNLTFETLESLGIDGDAWLDMVGEVTNTRALQAQGCIVCSTRLSIGSSDHIASQTFITSTESCTIETALKILHLSIKDGFLNYNWESQDLILKVELISNEQEWKYFIDSLYTRDLLLCRPGEVFTLDLVFCPGFRYTRQEFLIKGISNKTAERIIAQSTQVRPNEYMVCQQQYTELMNELMSGSMSVFPGMTVWILLVQVASIVKLTHTAISTL